MKFAFIGSCSGMDRTNNKTFSNEFRKGENFGTVTIGYTHMYDCPDWTSSLEWQDQMFAYMNSGKTMKQAYDLACADYPIIADYVKFVGDTELIVGNNPPCPPEKPSGDTSLLPNEQGSFNTTTFDPEDDIIYYLFDWNDGTDSGWIGPYNYGENVVAEHTWNNEGTYFIKVKAKDEHQLESDWTTLEVTIPKNKTISMPFLQFLENHPQLSQLLEHLLGL
jgi:hypothetical protein